MGSGKKKDHESFTVAPADEPAPSAKSTPAIAPVTAGDTSMLDQYTSTESLTAISGAGSFADMSHAVGSAQAGLATAAGQSAEQQIPQLAAESNKAIHTASQDWLKGKSKAELEEIAAAEGFPHPEMVSDHALMAWLDPSYPADSEYKAKIAAKSIERYNDAVAAGKIVPKAEEMPEGFWKATPAEVLDAQAAFLTAAENVPKSGSSWGNKTEKLDELIVAENKLATAHCPELGDSLEASKAQAKQLVDERIASSHTAGDTLVKHAIDKGQLPAHADLLAKSEALQLVRASTPAEQKATLSALIDQRAATVAEMNAAKATLLEHYDGKLYGKPKPFGSAQDIIDFNTASKQYRSGLHAFNGWHAVASKPMYMGDDALAQGLRHGAKSLSMDQMRAAATMQGLKDNKGASRAQLQNWMIGQWHSGYNPDEIAAQFGAKKPQPKPQPAPTPTPVVPKPKPAPASGGTSSSSAGSNGGGSVTPFSPTAGSGKWFNKQQQMVAALKHQAASLADAPARPPAAEVASWKFGKGPAMHLGGAHTKEVVSAPDGSLWMFKPTKDSYRAQSESGANGILHRAGIPTVPVYAHTHEGQKGTVQPLMKGATTFPSSPSDWSQSDVDAIVRYHAAAWLVGDHDAKYDNLLRTPNGGVVPIDHGQAFKFWGQDKLAADYHPNSAYGSKPPVWNVLYDAAKNGQLAPGVKVRSAAALPVIKSIESIPDAEFKAMLEPSAKTGAHSGSSSHWRPVFEKRAAAKHGGKATTQQVADEFVAYGVERKNALRQSFTKLFADLGIDKADTISKVA